MKTTTRRCLLSLLGFSAAPILTACYDMPYYDEYLDMPFDGFSGKIVDVNTQEPIQNIKVHFTEQIDSTKVVEHSALTDAEGKFSFDHHFEGQITVSLSDIDGQENGSYKDTALEINDLNNEDCIFKMYRQKENK
ncbi:MAG: radical SAM-associated putative lipoprotein [Alistipes sp.]|nr:radical SAM-associated putative lipoprotein [Alistipes sp.]